MSVYQTHQLVHSVYMQTGKNHDVLVANIKNTTTNESELMFVEDPTVKVWVTKLGLRNHSSKKEYAEMSEVDMYSTKYCEVGQTLAKALGQSSYGQNNFFNQRKLLSSPFVYGADIDIGVRIKGAFRRSNPNQPSEYNVGTLDIESSVLGNNEIILISFINGDGNCFCSILNTFFKPGEGIDDVKKKFETRVNKQFREALKPKIQKLYDENPLKIHYFDTNNELEMIKWLFARIHECKPDFIGIWNMGYDIPRIIERLEFHGINPADIMCHPEVPKKFRICKFNKDKGRKDYHITDYWDWFELSGYTQFIDVMQLYGRLRKAKGRDISYKLDYIGAKELGTGKLAFGGNRTHADMQKNSFVDYTVYNIVDNAILFLMNLKNQDVTILTNLIGPSNLQDFSKQTIQLKNLFFEWLLPQDKVPASIGEPIDQDYDKWITNQGGAVLDPKDARKAGVPILKESDRITTVQKYIHDIDARALYPSLMQLGNVSKETKLSTALAIDNSGRVGKVECDLVILEGGMQVTNGEPVYRSFKVDNFFIDAIYASENAVSVGNEFFDLPSYEEMAQLIAQGAGIKCA